MWRKTSSMDNVTKVEPTKWIRNLFQRHRQKRTQRVVCLKPVSWRSTVRRPTD